MSQEAQCTRFRRGGEPCTNTTDYADGWCREPGCDGYLRGSTTSAPESVGAPRGTAAHIARADSPRPAGVEPIQGYEVRLTLRATESFQFHHGGDRAAAETELRTMLEDFSLRGVGQERDGYLALAREGCVVTLNPERDVVVGYSTVHRESAPGRISKQACRRGSAARAKPLARDRQRESPSSRSGPTTSWPSSTSRPFTSPVPLSGEALR